MADKKTNATEAVTHELAEEVMSNLIRDMKDVPVSDILEHLFKKQVHNVIHSVYQPVKNTTAQTQTPGFRPGANVKNGVKKSPEQTAEYWYNMYNEEIKKAKQ